MFAVSAHIGTMYRTACSQLHDRTGAGLNEAHYIVPRAFKHFVLRHKLFLYLFHFSLFIIYYFIFFLSAFTVYLT